MKGIGSMHEGSEYVTLHNGSLRFDHGAHSRLESLDVYLTKSAPSILLYSESPQISLRANTR